MAEAGGFGGGVTGFVVEDPLPVAVDILDHRRGLQRYKGVGVED
ncbi:MAG: hypothetical protein ABF384_17575 [Verrucomicrobiales bacterium]